MVKSALTTVAADVSAATEKSYTGQLFLLPRFRSVAILAAACTVLIARPASAQLTLPNALTTPFDNQSLPSLTDLRLTNTSAQGARHSVTVGIWSELTARTHDSLLGTVANFHANGHYIAASYRLSGPNSPAISMGAERISATDDLNDVHTQVDANANFTCQYFSIQQPLGHQSNVRFTIDGQRYSASGTSNIYQGIFGIFPSTPPFQLEKRFDGEAFDYLAPYWRGWQAEAVVALQDSPGRIGLISTAPVVEIELPLSESGSETMLCLARSIGRSVRVVAYRGHGSWAGSGPVDRENNRAIGTADNRRTQIDTGVGALIDHGDRRYSIYYDTRHDAWSTHGVVESGEDLGVPIPIVGTVRYDAAYDLRVNTLGASVEHDFRRGQRFRFDYRWVTLRPWAGADYSAQIIIIAQRGASSTGGDWLRGHELTFGYTYTNGRTSLTVSLDQIIPVSGNPSRSSTTGSGGPAGSITGSRTSDGGRFVSAELTIAF